jgi:hypothetical protein
MIKQEPLVIALIQGRRKWYYSAMGHRGYFASSAKPATDPYIKRFYDFGNAFEKAVNLKKSITRRSGDIVGILSAKSKNLIMEV